MTSTEDDDQQVSAGEGDQVVVHGSVQVGAADDDIAHREVADDPRHEDDQIEDSNHDEGVGVIHLLGPKNNQKVFLLTLTFFFFLYTIPILMCLSFHEIFSSHSERPTNK